MKQTRVGMLLSHDMNILPVVTVGKWSETNDEAEAPNAWRRSKSANMAKNDGVTLTA